MSAGYSVIRTKNRFKEPCDICGRPGNDVELKKNGVKNERTKQEII